MTLHEKLKQVLAGEYHLSDGRVFWMDELAVNEILHRLENFEVREKPVFKDWGRIG